MAPLSLCSQEVAHAPDSGPKGGTASYPSGKPIPAPELGLARQHAPLSPRGTMKCWDAASHMGCKSTWCPRSHEPIKPGSVHWTVQAQLIRR
eukprot:10106779-Heterocapsa_arctica.AAC.1